MPKSDVVLRAPVRTAIGAYGGSLKGIAAPDLGAAVIAATIERAKVNETDVDTVVMGAGCPAGAKMNPARRAARAAGMPAMTVTSPVPRRYWSPWPSSHSTSLATTATGEMRGRRR
jgi:acetyl-CoA C-acetyltransferase